MILRGDYESSLSGINSAALGKATIKKVTITIGSQQNIKKRGYSHGSCRKIINKRELGTLYQTTRDPQFCPPGPSGISVNNQVERQ